MQGYLAFHSDKKVGNELFLYGFGNSRKRVRGGGSSTESVGLVSKKVIYFLWLWLAVPGPVCKFYGNLLSLSKP